MGYSNRMSPHDYRSPTVHNPTPEEIWRILGELTEQVKDAKTASKQTLDAIQGNESLGHKGIAVRRPKSVTVIAKKCCHRA